MAELSKTRIDKWLWAVRIFKTRTLASKACDGGKVKIEGKAVKAAYKIGIGETVTVKKGPLTIIYKVEGIIEKRVSAVLAKENYEDLSPPPPPKSSKDKLDSAFNLTPDFQREKGMGRPTKKDRREINKWFNK